MTISAHKTKTVRASCATIIAAAIVLGGVPVHATTGLGDFEGPITTWLAGAPASCVLNRYFTIGGPRYYGLSYPDSNHVAYWVGHAMDNDGIYLRKLAPTAASWHGGTGRGTERIEAVYDPALRVAAYFIGGQDMDEFGLLADEPGPPSSAPPMRANLSKLSLGGNVHLGDSLATVSGALGLHALTPTEIPQCPGFSAVELCDWNVARCACPPAMHYRGSHDISGTIIFGNRRVAGLLWDAKCFAGG